MSSSDRTRDDRVLTVLLIPDGGTQDSRTLLVPYRRLRMLGWAAGSSVVILALLIGSWWYFAARSLHVGSLEARVAAFEGDRARVAALAAELEELESSYGRIRSMFGPEGTELPSNLWLPPAGGSGQRPSSSDSFRPTSWPLTEKGFVTQGLLAGGQNHPGLDIAVPMDSYIRAAGAGAVVEAGRDPTYGNYVVIDHGHGLRSLYGHAASLLVEEGQEVRQNEVIALSGSTGRSTAPHLHFEIIRNGQPIDPLELVRQP